MTNSALPTESDLRLSGFTVNRCIIDFAFTIELVKENEVASLRIEAPFECLLDGGTMRCDPENDPQGLGPALAALRRSIEVAAIAADDSLQILFSGSMSLRIPRDSNFESWSLSGPGDLLVVAGPGSRLSRFLGRENQPG